MTSGTYTNLMQTLNPREGTEMNERLQKLQELEKLRKEREATRQQLLQRTKDKLYLRSSRLRSTDQDNNDTAAPSYSYGIRRGLSRSNSEDDQQAGYTYVTGDYGARPKQSGYSFTNTDSGSSYTSKTSENEDLSDLFSNITSQVLGRNKWSNAPSSYSSSVGSRPGFENYNSSSYQYSGSNARYGQPGYTRSYSDDQSRSILDNGGRYYSRRRQQRAARDPTRQQESPEELETENIPTEYSENSQGEEGEQNAAENDANHDDINHDYEEGEEPKHFIERLKNGSPVNSKRGVDSGYGVSNIPTIPPLKKQKPDGVNDLVDDDILAVAKDIRATFGIKSPNSANSETSEKQFDFSSNKENLGENSNKSDFVFTAKTGDNRLSKQSNGRRKTRRSLRGSRESLENDKNSLHTNASENNENADESVIIEEYTIDDPDDDLQKILPISEDYDKSAWLSDMAPGQLNKMHEYFTGETADDEPVIDRVLDGRGVKNNLEKSFTEDKREAKVKTPEQQKGAVSSLKSAFGSLVQFGSSDRKNAASSSDASPENESETSSQKTNKRNKAFVRPNASQKSSGKHKAIQKVKGVSKSSDSDNDSFQTASESESDYKNSRRASGASTPTKHITEAPKNGGRTQQDKSDMGLTLGDKLAKLETMTQEKKRKQSATESEGKRSVPSYMSGTSASQNKSRAKSPAGLAKDVRELKKFVHEHTSETKTPVHMSRKDVVSGSQTPKKTVIVKEIATQTDENFINTVSPVYVCIHCGKSSDQKIDTAFSDAGTTDGEDTESLDRYETRSETGYNLRSKKLHKASTPKWTFGKNENRKTPSGTKSYMKGTTSSGLKTNVGDSNEKVRKTSVPDIQNEAIKMKKGKSIVAQRAKELETAAKKGEQKRMAFAAQRSNSTERKKSVSDKLSNEKSKLGKSKSVETMHFIKSKPKYTFEINTENAEKDINSNVIKKDSESRDLKSPSGEKRSRSQMLQKSPERENQSFSKDGSFTSPNANKPPPVAPKPKRYVESDKDNNPASPTKTDEVFETAVESKGQFTRLENNPFIRNDAHRRNSFKDRNDGESVWEKSESRSASSASASPQRESNLNRSHSSAGEKSSLTNLHWSDSGSSESLHASKSSRAESSQRGSKSSLHGSFESLPRSPQRPRSSSTSSNTMLNLLSPIGTVRNPVTGTLETDVDAAYDNAEGSNDDCDDIEHNEETVERAHLEFAKQACDMLEFESKQRDSSSDSQKGSKKQGNTFTNGQGTNVQVNGHENSVDDKASKKNKHKKGFFKVFKK